MGDLDPELRAQIDAKVAAGEVTKIPAVKPRAGSKSLQVQERQSEVKRLHDEGNTVAQIVNALSLLGIHVTAATVQSDKKALGLVKPRHSRGPQRTVDQRKALSATRGAEKVADRRRFKVVPVPFGAPSVLMPADATGPMFPNRVFTPDGSELVLKDGCNNSKIGCDVLVGWLKGAYIATLTLPERTTCPTNCKMWRGCYGNSMHYARRWSPGPELEAQIKEEVTIACTKNERVLIRLHVLGDFYSIDYLQMWAELLDEWQNLHIFGFTAHLTDTKLGRGIAWLREQEPRRFMVRTSGQTGDWGSFTLPFPTQEKSIGDAIVCPEQLDGMKGSPEGRHCGNCGVCWSTDKPIAFVEH